MAMEINRIPARILERYNANRAAITARADNGASGVYITSSLAPENLHETSDLACLADLRLREGVHSITMILQRLDNDLIDRSTSHLGNRYRLISELDTLLRYERDVYVVYVVTHFNPGQRPLGPMTVNIGGDCYRTGREIKDLASILNRTRDLAEAMLKKAVMIFPHIPALHGGKKGEWIILDRGGRKIDGISEEGIIALGSSIIPRGIGFLNRSKELEARRLGICDRFPERDYIRPDSGSPDVLSGIYWRGEVPEKYINMCDAWSRRGEDLSSFTCLPDQLGGTRIPSAVPTGYGVATTTAELARRYFEPRGKGMTDLGFLLEAAGGVGTSTVEALVGEYGVPPGNLTVFDKSEDACSRLREKFGVRTVTLGHADVYEKRLPEDVARRGRRFDVWINNGEGDNTTPAHVANLLDAGIRVFTGGANNFLEVESQQESLDRIFAAGGWTWPDPATSGGGWTLAVIDLLTRCQGRAANTVEIRDRILEIISSRNRRLVTDALDTLPPDAGGDRIWRQVDALIDTRVRETLGLELTPEEILERADTRTWQLD